MRMGVCTAVRAGGVRAAKGGESMCVFAVIAVVCALLCGVIAFFSDEVIAYLTAKTEEIRALTEEIRASKRQREQEERDDE